jgi:hypothetical protein
MLSLVTNTTYNPTTVPTTFYADQVNAQFKKSQSHYVGLAQRLSSYQIESWQVAVIDDAIAGFKQRYSHLTSWSDLKFCTALTSTLDLIDIDVTLQRVLDVVHVANIIDHFIALMAQPISVYEDPIRPGRYICWDGQHTAIVLFIIARILKLDISKVEVPIVIYASNQKSEMRECFITLNGPEGKKTLDHIDKIHQKIYGVRTDGSTRPDWLLVEAKQQIMEQNKIFLTHRKFGNDNEGGAQSRMDEFIDDSYDLEVNQNFAKCFFKTCYASRPVQPKESWMMYEFFRLCQVSKITVDDQYIAGVAHSLKTAFNGDFDSIGLYNQAKSSYQNWWMSNKPNPDGTLWGISYSEYRIGMTFLIKQIAKNFNGTMPKYTPHWDIPAKDLF